MTEEARPKLKAPRGTCDTHIHVYASGKALS